MKEKRYGIYPYRFFHTIMNCVDIHFSFLQKVLLGCLFSGIALGVCFTGLEGQLFFFSQSLVWIFLFSQLVSSRGQMNVHSSLFCILLATISIIFYISSTSSPVPGYSQVMFWRQNSILIVCISLVVISSQDRWRWIKGFILFLSLVLLVYAVAQYFLTGQPKATFLNKNSFAGFLLPVIFWNFLPAGKKYSRCGQSLLLLGGGLVFGLIGSRGALLSFIVGAVSVVVLIRFTGLSIKRFLRPIALFASGLFCSLFFTGLQIGAGRLVTLSDPMTAGADRFLIWQSSWQMLKDAPWYGIGIGLYGLVYPQYRNVADRSAGHFAHNDLLQLFIETGWPGFFLIAALVVALVWMVWSSLVTVKIEAKNKYEIIVLASGLVAVCFHSLFTFNFYVYSTLMVIGIVLARIISLAPESITKIIKIDLSKYGKLMPWIPSLLCSIPLFLLGVGGWSQIATANALEALQQDDTVKVIEQLAIAKRLWPSNDFNWYMEGEVLRTGLKASDQIEPENRMELVTQAEISFNRAIELNPLRAMTPHKLGLLLEGAAEENSTDKIISLYEKSLEIDPRYFTARMDLARIYYANKKVDIAKTILESGLVHHYQNTPALIPYLKLTGDFMRQQGERGKAILLDERILEIENTWRKKG